MRWEENLKYYRSSRTSLYGCPERVDKDCKTCACGGVFRDLRLFAADTMQVSKQEGYKYKFKRSPTQGFVAVFVS